MILTLQFIDFIYFFLNEHIQTFKMRQVDTAINVEKTSAFP